MAFGVKSGLMLTMLGLASEIFRGADAFTTKSLHLTSMEAAISQDARIPAFKMSKTPGEGSRRPEPLRRDHCG